MNRAVHQDHRAVADSESVQRIAAQCEQTGIPFRVLPSLQELADQQVAYGQLRSVTLEDLLRREPVQLDMQSITAYLKNETVLMTGGGGYCFGHGTACAD